MQGWFSLAFFLILATYLSLHYLASRMANPCASSSSYSSSSSSSSCPSAHHHRPPPPPPPQASTYCTKRDDYLDDDEEEGNGVENSTREDPWWQVKWVGKPSKCLVKGHLIERIESHNNFRRGYALRFTPDVEDKTHLLPWLLGSRIDLNTCKRRVYLDLGANRFSSSVKWFMRMYPCDFTEIHAFEANQRSWRLPKKGFDEISNIKLDAKNSAIKVKQTPNIPQYMLDRVSFHLGYVSDVDNITEGRINITRVIKEELHIQAEDALVVKMDIEGSEWPILKRWMEDLDMPTLIDELFVEIHYEHPSMKIFGWDSFQPISRRNAHRLLADLRWKGFFVHAWP